MATYAAFKHVELYNVGKAKKRVLKPPGGGSSDIFGTDNMSAGSTPRSKPNHMTSNIFAAPTNRNVNDSNRRNGGIVDSHNRLFGNVDRPYTPAKNNQKSNIPIGGAEGAAATPSSLDSIDSSKQTNGKTNGNSVAHTNGNGKLYSNGDSNGLNGNSTRNESDDCSESSMPSPRIEKNTVKLSSSKLSLMELQNGHNNLNNTKYSENINNISVNDGPLTNLTSTTSSFTTNSSFASPQNNASNVHAMRSSPSGKYTPRNPVTGYGIESRMQRSRKADNKTKDGNPITGEGYKGGFPVSTSSSATEINTTVPSLNGGSKHVINKNRIPPGGFSSGLW